MSPELIKSISVVVPVHNESGNVEKLIDELTQVDIENIKFEFIFVDDFSSDNTLEILAKRTIHESRLRVLRHKNNCGQSTAVRSGILAARYNWICTLDGDGQNNPADIHKLIALAQTKLPITRPLLIMGNRRHARKDTFVRRTSSLVANKVRAKILGDSTPDSGCGLKLFDRVSYLALPYFDHMHRFLPPLFLREGGAVFSVDIGHRDRLQGVSHYGISNRLWVGIVDILGVAWLKRRAFIADIEEVKPPKNL